ncbi:MAG: adenosylmethionine--8-amino-7-oxononanoate transaminase, partial [Thermodesulfovibrionales bacterium]|nr:adenosylmethionine--8-amino-7-oxononanoate transaminase [Thermodesulfovibrionales bacterium]
MNYLNGIEELEKKDKLFIWHPFTQMKDWLSEKPLIIVEGKDCFLKDQYGKWYLDGVSSIWVNIHGHRRKEVDEAIKEQLDKIAHSTLLGLSNVPSIVLAEKLINLINDAFAEEGRKLCKVFYSDNGSTSVEIALKMAFQYWQHKGENKRTTFLSLKNSYHGDTIGSVSVGGIDIFHKIFEPLLFKTIKAPSPYCYRCEFGKTYPECSLACLRAMEELLRNHSEEIAAVIIEPMVQGAGGIIVFPDSYLKGVRKLCDEYKVLLIADEVATGFGRTGKMFACEHEKVVPDFLCLSKGITNGYMPLAVTITTEEVFSAFLGEFSELKTFFHGHSYTGNPLACSAAIACLDIFRRDETLKTLQPKISLLKERLRNFIELEHVGDIRNKGFMTGIELVKDKAKKEPYPIEAKIGWKVVHKAREKG